MSSNKKPEKSPYKSHTIEEVMQAEAGHYYIQIGDGMFESESGKLAFTKDRAENFYFQIWEGLKDMKANGSKKDREEALNCLLNFRIIPLRFH
ncbi:MAG: hypothetical protein HC840_00770 [Leptolyngbyaceae cyanobacterium RM2_2_4]|nr:hypothetical protein [Leptolyngbyaceae cyanobacterium RM2_2_4]